MAKKNKIEIPVIYENGKEDVIEYKTISELVEEVKPTFVEPGYFGFNKHTIIAKKVSHVFEEYGTYTPDLIEGTADWIEFWENEKKKILNGVWIIVRNNNKVIKKWFFPGEYYFWINFLPIYNKEEKKYTFPEIRDVQLYMALYRWLAEKENKHAVIVKKRQIASSYYHAAVLIRALWFMEGSRNKLISYNETPGISTTWDYLVNYRDFLNSNTAWIRAFRPDQVYNWKQQTEIIDGKIKRMVGLKSELVAKVMSDNPTGGVGGGNTYVFYEEAGIAPTLDKTFEYIAPSLKEGDIITGQFIAAGSVGSLEQCEPLRKYIFNPSVYDFYGVQNNHIREGQQTPMITGCFIPQHWGMKPYIDEYGNSMIEEALSELNKKREKWRKELPADIYSTRVSQEPITLEEVFYFKRSTTFPEKLIRYQILRIEASLQNQQKEYKYKTVILERESDGKVVAHETNKLPIDTYPLPPTYAFKEGVVQIWEDPIKTLPFGTYIAGIDPVVEGETKTSPSLFSIYIVRDDIKLMKDGRMEVYPATIAACWTGRFSDINKTNEQALRLVEYYNAIAVVERDVSFIQYVLRNKKAKYLMPSDNFVLNKEPSAVQKKISGYGWKNTGDLFRKHLIPMLVSFMKEEYQVDGTDGEVITKIGIERIKDKMVLYECMYYDDGYNVDRVVALTSAIAYMNIQSINRGNIVYKENKKELEYEDWIKIIAKRKQQIKQFKSYFNNLN